MIPKPPPIEEILITIRDDPPRRRTSPWRLWLWPLVISGGLAALLTYGVREAREAARKSQCVCNLCQIKLALLNYHDLYGSFPPAYVADASGRRMHSWRVLIMPLIQGREQEGYPAYNLAEPWDGPNNRKLLNRMPSIFACPSRERASGSTVEPRTSYVVVVGDRTVFPGRGVRSIAEIRDGIHETLLIAEVANVDIPWTEPRDLEMASMGLRIDDPKRPSVSSRHPAGPSVAMVDGSYRSLKPDTPPGLLKAMLTVDGGEVIDRDGPAPTKPGPGMPSPTPPLPRADSGH